MKNLLGQAFINNSIDVIIIIYFLNLPSLISWFFLLLTVAVPDIWDILEIQTSMKWISYQISMSYNKLYLFNSGISGSDRERERERVILCN